jgi:soluble lytic murein transglycosylase-like protein
MAYAGGIGQEIDQLKDLSVQELVRRQNLDPSLIYTIALQERQKMDAAGARQGVLDEPKPEGTVTSRMEQELAQQTMPQAPVNRVAPGIMQQGQRSMQQQGPQMGGISGVPANNMGAVGRARGGIIGYADGGDVGPTLYDKMGKQYLPGQPLPEGWQTLTNAPRKIQLPFNPAGEEFAGELREMERTRRENSTRTIPEFLSDFTFSRSNTAKEALRSPLPALLQSLVDSGSMSNQEAVNELQKILSGPKGMGQRGRWNRENPNFASQLKAMKEARERVLDAQEEGMARGGVVGYADGGMLPQTQIPTIGAQQAATATPQEAARIRAYKDRIDKSSIDKFLKELKYLNEAKANAFPQEKAMFQQQIQDLLDTTPAAIRNAVGGAGMARGGVVGYRDGEVDMEALLDALMMAESGGDPDAVGDAGEEGAFQIRPSTAADPGFGVPPMKGDRFDPEASRDFARQYLQAMIDRYDGDVEAGLIAYNAGFGNADKFIAANRDYDVLPQTKTTQPYVRSIMGEVEKEAPVIAGFPTQEETDKAFTDAGLSGYGDGSRIRQRGRTGPEKEKLPQFDERSPQIASFPESPNAGIAGYLKNIGRQQQQRRDDFREAVPGAEAAVARAKQEKEDGGIGYLRRIGRLQEGAAQRQAEEEERAAQFLAMLIANQNKSEVEPVRPFVNESFKNGGGVKRFNGEDGNLVEGEMTEAEKLQAQLIALDEESILDLVESAVLTKEEREEREGSRRERMGEIVTADVKGLANAAFNLPANVVGTTYNALTQPNAVTRAMQKAAEASGITDFLRGTGLPDIPTPAPSSNTLTRNSNAGTGPKTQQEFFQELARKQKDAGTVEAFRAKRRAEEEERRRNPPAKTGIAGALDKAKPLGGLALRLAEVLGRGAGASKGFEGAKILEESSRLRSEEAAMQLSRDQIAATTGQNQTRTDATVNAMIVRAITAYTGPLNQQFIADKTAKAAEMKLEEGDPKVEAAVIKDFVAMLRNSMDMGNISNMQGLGGGEGGRLSEDVASAQAYLAETS